MVHIQGLSQVRGHKKRVHVFVYHPDKPYSKSRVTTPSYSYLHAGSNRVTVALQNLTSRTIKLTPKTIAATIIVAKKFHQC